jgi:hypothetical protein
MSEGTCAKFGVATHWARAHLPAPILLTTTRLLAYRKALVDDESKFITDTNGELK